MPNTNDERDQSPPPPERPRIVGVYENRPAGYEGTCLRPLGLCELGGSCDTCWYSPDHPRHRSADSDPD